MSIHAQFTVNDDAEVTNFIQWRLSAAAVHKLGLNRSSLQCAVRRVPVAGLDEFCLSGI